MGQRESLREELRRRRPLGAPAATQEVAGLTARAGEGGRAWILLPGNSFVAASASERKLILRPGRLPEFARWRLAATSCDEISRIEPLVGRGRTLAPPTHRRAPRKTRRRSDAGLLARRGACR